mmetsp:Transcript_10115/g.11832  ORF Transcript_10115/g.11832 Transcript_10115/m.11832 type:complete len:279 (-) Transcript_10115:251-1087(-)|eukprot:CAMPEP_0197863242 /NCGR_PEP_ID=MMETSP1438-20131217/40549_1 /TAXON_ID=1461541 /ORGANISM="Pterosperma sp., Strain CCMP1384" /LENGTH=278 /DNA_ID=CAMNT_0043481063 /DNA_START=175 /DNA_END=1011 /DNA_ORIENTATION=-
METREIQQAAPPEDNVGWFLGPGGGVCKECKREECVATHRGARCRVSHWGKCTHCGSKFHDGRNCKEPSQRERRDRDMQLANLYNAALNRQPEVVGKMFEEGKRPGRAQVAAIRDMLAAGERTWMPAAVELLGVEEEQLLQLVPLDDQRIGVRDSTASLTESRLRKLTAELGVQAPPKIKRRRGEEQIPDERETEEQATQRARKVQRKGGKSGEQQRQEKRERLRKRIRESGYTGDVEVMESVLAQLADKAVKNNGRGAWMVQKYARLHKGARSATLY